MRFYLYIFLVAAVLILGWLMPQQGPKRKYYIILMAVIHAFICGFRYNHLTGDLMKYHNTFNQTAGYGWFSDQILSGGRNFGFNMFLKLVHHLTGGDFQVVLLIIAVLCEYAVAVLVFRYSPKPWMSYLVWNCLAFFIFGFSAIKQAMAMAFVMLSAIGILEGRPKLFLIMVLLAGSIHVPALVFLPAYWLSNQKINLRVLAVYVVVGVLLFIFKNQVVSFIRGFYYEEEEIMIHTGSLGNRFFMIFLVVLCGVLLKGFHEKKVEALFHLMVVSVILQMFAGFDNIFTRLTDYYFQFSVLYIPMLFYKTDGVRRYDRPGAVFRFNQESLRIFAAVVSVVLLYFYWTYTLSRGNLTYTIDDYLNFRFMWDVP